MASDIGSVGLVGAVCTWRFLASGFFCVCLLASAMEKVWELSSQQETMEASRMDWRTLYRGP